MRALVAGVLAVLAVTAVGGNSTLYQNKFCSTQNCSTNNTVAFTVNVFDGQSFYFASQCCQGQACNTTSTVPEPAKNLTNAQCSACYEYNSTNCTEQTRQCNVGERCVHIIADFINGTESDRVELKGCSDISNSTCEFLSAENRTVGEVIFRNVNCTEATVIPTADPATADPATADPATADPATADPATADPATPDATSGTPTRSSSSASSVSSLVLPSLLLLKLLL